MAKVMEPNPADPSSFQQLVEGLPYRVMVQEVAAFVAENPSRNRFPFPSNRFELSIDLQLGEHVGKLSGHIHLASFATLGGGDFSVREVPPHFNEPPGNVHIVPLECE